ncbi:MAG TPA: DUF4375 domain-containing protein [Gemmataceae bacterium]|jgi:hypothetical protein|nr:DUF4375 domain-containing protein [Gemmataceae bacterium]
MPEGLSAILAKDDFDLCNGLFTLLIEHHGEAFNPPSIPVEHRTVLLIWLTNSVITSRGFNGFFANRMLVDHDYRHTQAAYEAIDCPSAATALRKVFDAFPERIAPEDPRERVQLFGKANHAVNGALNRDFINTRDALTAALAKYIRVHADRFAGVEQQGQRPTTEGLSSTRLKQKAQLDPAQHAADLPYWARVAFHARVARQVLPLWEEAWPEAPHEHHEAVEQAVVLGELCASEGKTVGNLRTAAAHAAQVAEAALTEQSGGPAPNFPQRAALIAATAGSVLDLIVGIDASGSYGFAKLAIENSGHDELIDEIREDFIKLRKLARAGEWTDKTPVSPDVFDAAYKPKKSWWKKW